MVKSTNNIGSSSTDNEMKYISQWQTTPDLLYNLAIDPLETINLITNTQYQNYNQDLVNRINIHDISTESNQIPNIQFPSSSTTTIPSTTILKQSNNPTITISLNNKIPTILPTTAITKTSSTITPTSSSTTLQTSNKTRKPTYIPSSNNPNPIIPTNNLRQPTIIPTNKRTAKPSVK